MKKRILDLISRLLLLVPERVFGPLVRSFTKNMDTFFDGIR